MEAKIGQATESDPAIAFAMRVDNILEELVTEARISGCSWDHIIIALETFLNRMRDEAGHLAFDPDIEGYPI